MSTHRRLTAIASVAGLAVAVPVVGSETAAATGGEDSGGGLAGVCPSTVVWQTGWVPQAEHGPIYQLLGGDYEIDAAHKRVTGVLVDDGHDTGVELEVRAGGPAIGFSTVSAQMYLDTSILLGGVNTDEAIQLSATQPTVGVVTPDQLSPLMIMWDPEVHPDWDTIEDIGQSGSRVLYFDGTTYMSYLTGSGILQDDQPDGSFDGTPSAFVAQGAEPAQQGYATQDPYLYEHDVVQYGKPVRYQLIDELGYSIYPDQISVRQEDVVDQAECLAALVPMIQRATVGFATDPARTQGLIVELSDAYDIGSPQSPGLVEYGTVTQREIGMLANGADGTVGSFDMDRVDHLIEIAAPIFAEQDQAPADGLTAADIVTNQYIDPDISLP